MRKRLRAHEGWSVVPTDDGDLGFQSIVLVVRLGVTLGGGVCVAEPTEILLGFVLTQELNLTSNWFQMLSEGEP